MNQNDTPTESFIRESKDKVNWKYISISINPISRIFHPSEDFIRDNKGKVDWKYISAHQKLSERFIREFKDKVDWDSIAKYQTLSEDFIREFKDIFEGYAIFAEDAWSDISKYQNLSENFIREFKDKVNWKYISIYQILSDEFIEEFKDKIDFSRPNIIFTRDIEPWEPCFSGAKKYLKIWNKDQDITWNDLLEKYPNKGDIEWLCKNLSGKVW